MVGASPWWSSIRIHIGRWGRRQIDESLALLCCRAVVPAVGVCSVVALLVGGSLPCWQFMVQGAGGIMPAHV